MTPSSRKRTAQAVLSASLKQHADAVASAVPSNVSSFHNPSQYSNTELFHTWRTHSTVNFHAFQDPQEVIRIRQALLAWYHEHRRKLPWRGDPPPWTGSTVDFIANSSKKAKTNETGKTNTKQKQTALTSFFDSSKSNKKSTATSERSATNSDTKDDTSISIHNHTTFPITPYGVWVSEIMLQQTRVEAVIPYWVKWMQSFPTLFDLAAATPEQVNAHWAGLGFYRRARFLHAGAQTVVAQYATSDTTIEWPTTVEAWQQLPGVGRYTASAICSICFQQNVPVVDGNVCRVLSRLRGVAQHVKAPVLKDQYTWTLLQPLVENTEEPGNVNQALMELGATYCAPSGTGIEDGDPLRDFYWSTRLVQPALEWDGVETPPVVPSSSASKASTTTNCPLCAADGVEQVIQQWRECQVIPNMQVYGHQYLPMTPPQSAKRVQVWQVAALVRNDNDNQRWLLVQRPPTGLLAGQWEFPCICLWDSADATTKTKPTKSVKKVVDPEPPTIPLAQKRSAWKTLMNILSTDTVSSVQKVGSTPLEHVFSHVKHIMWLQTGQVDEGDEDESLTTLDGRAMRWMNADDMKQVGITSGVKKILQAMEKENT